MPESSVVCLCVLCKFYYERNQCALGAKVGDDGALLPAGLRTKRAPHPFACVPPLHSRTIAHTHRLEAAETAAAPAGCSDDNDMGSSSNNRRETKGVLAHSRAKQQGMLLFNF